MTQMPPVHAANLVASSGNTPYGVDVIGGFVLRIWTLGVICAAWITKNFIHVEIHMVHVSLQEFSNLASVWLAAVLPAN